MVTGRPEYRESALARSAESKACILNRAPSSQSAVNIAQHSLSVPSRGTAFLTHAQ